MDDNGNVQIERLTTGVPTLDAILHGGFPTRTLNVITGGPGAGKSILALQILFHQAHLGKKGIYFTSIAEPSLKFLRYMQQFAFFDPGLFNRKIFFSDLSGPALSQGLEGAIDALKRQIADRGPAIVAIDSFKALRSRLPDPHAAPPPLLYDLVLDLAVSDVTAFVVGEYDEREFPFLTADPADGKGAYLKGLLESLNGREPAKATEALTSLLVNLLTVLFGLLGHNLTYTFLSATWPKLEVS